MVGSWRRFWIEPAASNPPHRKEARIAFTTMWVAGTLGAYFTALSKNLPVDIRHWALLSGNPIDWSYSADRALRYGYILWLLAYFFVSNLYNQRLSKDDVPTAGIVFDVFQSALGIVILVVFGFLITDTGIPSNDIGPLALYANAAIALICGISCIFSDSIPPGLMKLRLIGLVVAIAGLAVAVIDMTFTLKVTALIALLVILWWIWCTYLWLTIDGKRAVKPISTVTEIAVLDQARINASNGGPNQLTLSTTLLEILIKQHVVEVRSVDNQGKCQFRLGLAGFSEIAVMVDPSLNAATPQFKFGTT